MSSRCTLALIALLAAVSLVCGCSEINGSGAHADTIIASFSASTTTASVGQSVQLTDTSSGSPTSWQWSFGDGASSAAQNPTHTYTTAGVYTVTLTAASASGSSTANRSIGVNASVSTLSAAFTSSTTTPITAQPVSFTDASTGSPSSWQWSFGDGATSTLQNPSHIFNKAGNFSVTLKVVNGSNSSTVTKQLNVNKEVSATGYDMTLTLSDGAQSTTLAFDGLALITGNLAAQSFFPPGKVADYTGFQYLRDTDPSNNGHNTDFLTRVAYNVIYTLNDAQMAQLVALAQTQQSNVDLYGYKRFVLMKAFRRLIDGDIPYGSAGLNLNAVKKASRELYRIDGQIAFERAQLYANVLATMNSSQLAYMDAMKGKGFTQWPDLTRAQVDTKLKALPQGTAVLVMTYASDIYSWYEGSLYADVYFCPERHGTYYGGFYIKDAPAVGVAGYTISEQLTNDLGNALLNPALGYVTQAQAAPMGTLVDVQRNALYAGDTNIVAIRTAIAALLRKLIGAQASAADISAQVLTLSDTYGDLDGASNHAYALAFAQLNSTLTTEQKSKLMTLRRSALSGTYSNGTAFDFTVATAPYLYSAVINDLSTLTPYTGNTDPLFFEP